MKTTVYWSVDTITIDEKKARGGCSPNDEKYGSPSITIDVDEQDARALVIGAPIRIDVTLVDDIPDTDPTPLVESHRNPQF